MNKTSNESSLKTLFIYNIVHKKISISLHSTEENEILHGKKYYILILIYKHFRMNQSFVQASQAIEM